MKTLANPWVHGMGTYEPGRPIEEVARELGFKDSDEIIKLASNENALGPSPKAVQAMREAASKMHLYPDGSSFYIRRKLSRKLGVPMDEILMTHGSNEAIELLGHVFLGAGTNIVMADRAFVVYKLVAATFQAETISVPMKEHTHDLDAMLAAITPATRLVFISNPNNPTGTMVDGKALDRFMKRVPNHVIVVMDEAYVELLPPKMQPNTLQYVRKGRKICVLRTFSKTYGLAGLRLGYVVAPKEGIELLHRVRQPFNVNAMAQYAAVAALDDEEYVQRTRRMMQDGLAYLTAELDKMGVRYIPSVTNFLMVKVSRGREVFEALQRKRVIVRPMNSYGMPKYVRVTVGVQKENEHFIRALGEVLKEMGKLHDHSSQEDGD